MSEKQINTLIRVGNIGWLARDGMNRFEVVHDRSEAHLFTVEEATSIARGYGLRIETITYDGHWRSRVPRSG